MTQDEIMAMWNSVIKYAPSEVRITEFANLIAAKEREACAKVCEENATDLSEGDWDSACNNCADLIRARSNT